jgi:hypothetical protein
MMSFQSNGTAGLDGDGGRPERGRKKRLKGPHEVSALSVSVRLKLGQGRAVSLCFERM